MKIEHLLFENSFLLNSISELIVLNCLQKVISANEENFRVVQSTGYSCFTLMNIFTYFFHSKHFMLTQQTQLVILKGLVLVKGFWRRLVKVFLLIGFRFWLFLNFLTHFKFTWLNEVNSINFIAPFSIDYMVPIIHFRLEKVNNLLKPFLLDALKNSEVSKELDLLLGLLPHSSSNNTLVVCFFKNSKVSFLFANNSGHSWLRIYQS